MAMSLMLTISMKHCSIDIPPTKLKALANFSASSGELFWSPIVHLSVCLSVRPSLCTLFSISSSSHWANFSQVLHKASYEKGISTVFKWKSHHFSMGDNRNLKIHWRHLKIFFSKTTGPISTKLYTKHPWMKGYQVQSK